MHHPTDRAERRYCRKRVIAARRFIYEVIWRASANQKSNWEPIWGKYAKWNLNCTCYRCKAVKQYNKKPARIRREIKNAPADWWIES